MTDLPCLGKSWRVSLPHGPYEDGKMGHMAMSLCAGTLATEGKIKKHNSNGTICAVLGESVYMTCANRKDRITGLGCGKFPVVNKHSTNPEGGVASEALQPLVKEISLDHQANKLRVFSLTAATTRQLCWIKVAIA